jgi:hypothetical protein
MTKIESRKQLVLNKETLRTLSPGQLARVAGASGRADCDAAGGGVFVDPDSNVSQQAVGCPSLPLTFVTTSLVIQPGPVPAPQPDLGVGARG